MWTWSVLTGDVGWKLTKANGKWATHGLQSNIAAFCSSSPSVSTYDTSLDMATLAFPHDHRRNRSQLKSTCWFYCDIRVIILWCSRLFEFLGQHSGKTSKIKKDSQNRMDSAIESKCTYWLLSIRLHLMVCIRRWKHLSYHHSSAVDEQVIFS